MLIKDLTAEEYSVKKDGLTQSLLRDWQSCKRKFLFKINKFRPSGSKKVLDYGSMCHHILDEFYSLCPRNVMPDIESIIMEYRKTLEVCDEQQFEENAATAIPVYTRYWKHYQNEMSVLKPVMVELTVKSGALLCKVDLVSEIGKALWLYEHKNMGRMIDPENLVGALSLDHQVYIYDNILSKNGVKLAGCIYNIIRTPQLKRKVGESLKQFSCRILEDILGRPEFYFMRYQVSFVDRIKKDCDTVLKRAVLAISREKLFLPSFSACRLGSILCPYIEACSSGTTDCLMKIEKVHPEL